MDKTELFQHLLNQIQLHDEDILDALSQTAISHVDILAQSNQWHFHLKSAERFHPHVYNVFIHHLRMAFSAIAKVEVWWEFDQDQLTDDII